MRVGLIGALFGLYASAAVAATIPVSVGPGFSFSPATVTVAPGDTIVWTFFSTHTSTSDSAIAAEAWDSGVLSGGTFSHTFHTPGTYPYYCAIHSVPGGTFMNGAVIVAPVATAPAITAVTPSSGPPGTSVTITGSGFENGASVTFSGTLSPAVSFGSATTLQAVVPNIGAGAATIVVTNPNALSASFSGFAVTSTAIPALSPALLLLLALALAALATRSTSGSP